MTLSEQELFFTHQLLAWAATVDRPMPWKNEKNPYLIWLSEIILQQTRVEQGWSYYERFRQAYPTVQDLAAASIDEVLKQWEGLGYYSRARNLHFTANYIVHELNGVFPDTYTELLRLKGVGPYTAAAIASFAYDLPRAVVDGNVYRILTRVFGIQKPIDITSTQKKIKQLAQQLLDPKQPARYNQAIMDFGAMQCTPATPDCGGCPLRSHCVAFRQNLVQTLPLKSKKPKKKQRFFQYLVFEADEDTYIEQRTQKDIWQLLYQFPLIETSALIDHVAFEREKYWEAFLEKGAVVDVQKSGVFKQTLSHQKIVATFWKIKLTSDTVLKRRGFIKTKRENLTTFAFPKIIDWYLKDNSLLLF